MKILYHHRTASRDGQAVHIEEMIVALRAQGHEVVVVAPAGADTQAFGSSNRGVDRIRQLLPKAIYELLELVYSVVAYRRIAQAIRQHRPDVIYERYNLYLLGGIWARKRFGLPLLLEVNAPIAEERARFGGLAFPGLARWVQGLTWRGADEVLPVTEVLAGYVRRAGVLPERIRVIHNGINQAHFAKAPDNAEAKDRLSLSETTVLGFTGFVRDWHGLDRVIDWMATQAAERKIHLLVVGDGPARSALEQQARGLGLEGRVTFTGLIPRERVPEHVAAFDIALQPAVVPYASPLKLFEYLALGRAVVAPAEPNLTEILSHGINAELFDAADPAGLEHALDALIDEPARRAQLGDGARQTIQRLDLTWEANAGRVCRAFSALLDQKTSAGPAVTEP